MVNVAPITAFLINMDLPTKNFWPWIMLVARIFLFAFWQSIVAFGYLLAGSESPWFESAAWWPVTATFANILCILMLQYLFRKEGLRYRDLFRFNRATVKGDVVALVVFLVIAGPLSYLPNVLSAQWLFGRPDGALELFARPLPLWAILPMVILFPLTIALAELPIYFGYVMPRLELQIGKWSAVLLAALALNTQHVTLPLLFDSRFFIWRLVMFIPFALMVALMLRWRPHLLPYMVIIHGLMDLSAVWLVVAVSI